MTDARRLIVVRHGDTFARGEPPRRIGAASDLPLTDVGERQATVLGLALARSGIAVDTLLSGPLRRTTATAERIAQVLGGKVTNEIAPWMCEIDHGEDEGQPEAAVLARVGPRALDAWDRQAAPPPGWSVDIGAIKRGWARLLSPAAPAVTVAVTSSGVARFALMAGPIRNRPPLLKLRTGSYGVIEHDGTGLTCSCWNVRPGD